MRCPCGLETMICGSSGRGIGGVNRLVLDFHDNQRECHDFAFLIIVLIIVLFQSWRRSLYHVSISPSLEMFASGSHVASLIGYPFHLMKY